jgi:tight adherence protein C
MDILTVILTGGAAMLAGGSVLFLSLGVYENVLSKFLAEVQADSGGSVSGLGSLLIRKVGVINRRFIWMSYEARLRKQLIRGGEPHGYKPEDIMALQELGFVVGLFAGLIAANGLNQHLAWSLILALGGAYYPLMWVGDQVRKRHLLIHRALPYSLDLLTLSVEAGLDFTGALGKVVEKGKHGPLRDEFRMVLKQLKMGKTREEGLKALTARVDLPALTTFITALIQADKMGTSLGKVLRIQSTHMRLERTQRAEKLANEAPVKMLFPLIACIFPTVFMILFGPIVFAFMYGNVGG